MNKNTTGVVTLLNDADHLADYDPDKPGLEFYQPHENYTYGITMRDAGTGNILW